MNNSLLYLTKQKGITQWLLPLLLLVVTFAQAQIGVTVTNPTNTTPNLAANYTSFALAVADLNLVTAMSGPVTLTLAAGTSETAPAKGFNISTSSAGVLNATNTLTIVKAAGGPTVINAGVGTAAAANFASPDGMLYLSGSDFVTINGLTFTDANSTNATVAMEFGIALFKRAVGDGCNNNTIQNCIFNMQRINNSAALSPMGEGANAIEIVNSTAIAAVTPLIPTNGGTLATNGTNSNNRIYSNTINGGNAGIHLGGFAATFGVGPTPTATTFLGDIGNDIGGTVVGTGNTILNYGGGAAVQAAVGIRANLQWSVNIRFNTIDNNNGAGVNHVTTLRGIFAQAGISANATISNNTVTVRSGATTTALTAIDNGIGSTAAANTVDINNNTIRFSYTTATTGIFTAISNAASAATVNINNNNIQGVPATNYPSTGTVPVIVGGSPNGVLNITNNVISNFNMTSAPGGTLRAITATTPVGLYTCTGNTIENLSYSTLSATGNITGIYNLASATSQHWNANIIRNFSTPTTGILNGIQNNTVAGTFQCRDNQIHNFTTTAGGAGGFSANGINWSNANVDISGNIIYAINSTGTPGGTGGTINGIITGGFTAGNYTVSRNAIYNLSSNSTNAIINGINVNSPGINAVNNNLIGDLRAPFSTGNVAISGIISSNGTTNNIFHNTVNIAATTSSASTFGSSAIFFSSSLPINNVRNNIFVNTSAAGPTGGFAAAIRYTIAPTSTNFPASNNNNLYFVGVAAANKVLYCEGSTAAPTNGQQTLPNYKTYISTTLPVSGREALSVSADPNFVSIAGSNPITNFLQYPTAGYSALEQGGATGTGITTDFTGSTVRCPSGACPGGAGITTPDIGAWELNNSFCNSLVATLTNTTPVAFCAPGGAPVAMTGAGSGGTGTYTRTWSPTTGLWTNSTATVAYVGGTDAAAVWATPSAAGSYSLTITDGAGCTKSASKPFTVSPGIALVVTPIGGTSCPDVINLNAAASKPAGYDVLSGYTFAPTSGTYTALTGATNSLATGDDGTQTSIPIGFTFNYQSTAFTTFSITTNGAIGLGATAPGLTNLLSTTNFFIAPLWDDNNRSAGTIGYQVAGSAPNRTLTVEWNNISIGGGGSTLNSTNQFQIILSETSGTIQFRYGNLTPNTLTASIGITGGTVAQFISVTPGGPATVSSATANDAISGTLVPSQIASGTVYTFTPPPFTLTYAWTELGGNPAALSFAGNVATANTASPTTEFLSALGTYNFPVTVTNTVNGCTAPSQASVTIATASLLVGSPAVNFATRCAGQSITLTGTSTFSGGCGPYSFEWRENGVAISNFTSAASASSVGTTITVTSTTGLLVGMFVDVTAGTGAFSTLTRVTSITNATTFVVSAAPSTALVGATVRGRANGSGVNALPFLNSTNTLTLTPPIGAPVVYTLSITDAASDNQTGSVNVTVNALPVVLATPATATRCTVGATPTALVASGATSYTWSVITNLFTDAPASVAYVAATDFASVWSTTAIARTYTVTGTDGNGCVNTATATIGITAPPTIVSTTATPASVCSGSNSQLLVTATKAISVTGYSFAQTSGTFTPMVGGTVEQNLR